MYSWDVFFIFKLLQKDNLFLEEPADRTMYESPIFLLDIFIVQMICLTSSVGS